MRRGGGVGWKDGVSVPVVQPDRHLARLDAAGAKD